MKPSTIGGSYDKKKGKERIVEKKVENLGDLCDRIVPRNIYDSLNEKRDQDNVDIIRKLLGRN